MKKKIIALAMVMFLLVSIVSVSADLTLEQRKTPSGKPEDAPKQPNKATLPDPLPTENIVNEEGKVQVKSVPVTVTDYVRDRLENGWDADIGRDGINLYFLGMLGETVTWAGGIYTVKDDEGNRQYSWEFGEGGGIFTEYENGVATDSSIYDYYAVAEPEKYAPVEIPPGIADDFENQIRSGEFRIRQHDPETGDFTWVSGTSYGSYDGASHTLISKVEHEGQVRTTYITGLADGGFATMDADGNFEIRDAEGNYIDGFENGIYDEANGYYYKLDEDNNVVMHFDSYETDGTSELWVDVPGVGKRYTKISPNGDVTYSVVNAANDVLSRETQHRNGDITTSYFNDEHRPLYDERVNSMGWITTWIEPNNEYVYVVFDDQSIGKYNYDDYDFTEGHPKKGASSVEYWPEAEAEESKDQYAKGLQKANEMNRFMTGRWFVSAIFGFIMGLSDYSALSSALVTGKDWTDWMERVDQTFSKFLNVDYYISEICMDDYHRIGDEGHNVIETPDGFLQFIGHVEAERSGPIPKECPCADDEVCRGNVCYKGNEMQSEFFYKVTYGVTAPSDIKLTPEKEPGSLTAITFSVYLGGPGPIGRYLFVHSGTSTPYFYELENGQTQSGTGESAVLFYSSNVYDNICIMFGKAPLDAYRGRVESICNPISASQDSYLNWQSTTAAGVDEAPEDGEVPEGAVMINPDI